MITLRGYLLLFALATLLWAWSAAATAAEVAAVRTDFLDGAGHKVGTAMLTQTPAGVLIEVELANLPPGWKAFHVHAVGRCEPGSGFKTAGEHFAPRQERHGLHADQGPHAGDMPNQYVARDGTLRAQILNARVTLSPGETSLLDADGSALVFHAKADDYRSQPAGDAGDRIACATVGARGR